MSVNDIDPFEWAKRYNEEVITITHSMRFRKTSNRYPLRVTEAFDGNIARAAGCTDREVAERVREWELAHDLEPRDWPAIGREEGRS